VYRAEIVHVSILVPPREALAFVRDVSRWQSWAPWVQSVSRISEREWTLETDAGVMQVEFGEPNTVGVLDHHVRLASGLIVYSAMRIVPNGAGSELVMTLFQQPAVTPEEFERDLQAVREDLARLKHAAEAATP
jgi:hypothetical protein